MSVNDAQDWKQRIEPCADAAPSILNTKPWLFDRRSDERIDLYPHWERHLAVIDPRHRELVISCGAALFNLRMAIRVAGHDPVAWLLPDEQIPGTNTCPHCNGYCGIHDKLASIEIVTKRTHPASFIEERLYEASLLRHTIREPFRRNVQMNVLTELERVARAEKVDGHILFRSEVKPMLKRAAKADRELWENAGYRAELSRWTSPGAPPRLGVSVNAFPPQPQGKKPPPVRYFGPSGRTARFEDHPYLIALKAPTDTAADWLRLGQALQRVLLTATHYGVQCSFLTQQLELADQTIRTGREIRRPWPWPRSPQMVIRVGHV
jgi:hypothetical protein